MTIKKDQFQERKKSQPMKERTMKKEWARLCCSVLRTFASTIVLVRDKKKKEGKIPRSY